MRATSPCSYIARSNVPSGSASTGGDPRKASASPATSARHLACGNQGALKANRWRYVRPMTEQGPSPVTSIQLLGPAARVRRRIVGSHPQRSRTDLVAALASDAGLLVSADALIDAVWATLLPPASDTRCTSTCPRCAAAWATARRASRPRRMGTCCGSDRTSSTRRRTRR